MIQVFLFDTSHTSNIAKLKDDIRIILDIKEYNDTQILMPLFKRILGESFRYFYSTDWLY